MLAAVLVLLVAAGVVVQRLGGFESAAYRPVEPGTWVTTGQFRARVVAVTWRSSGFTSGDNKGAHYLSVSLDVENVSDLPGSVTGDSLLAYRLDGKDRDVGSAGTIKTAHGALHLTAGTTRRVVYDIVVRTVVRSTAPARVDVLLLETERTRGQVPDDFLFGNYWQWRPTGKVVATVRTPVRS